MEQKSEPTVAVELPITDGRTSKPGGFSLSVEKFCLLSCADVATLLSGFPPDVSVRLVSAIRKNVYLNRKGVESKNQRDAQNGLVASKVHVITENSLNEFSLVLKGHGVRVLDNFCAEVSWDRHRAVLKFGPGQRKTLLSITSDSEDPPIFWPV